MKFQHLSLLSHKNVTSRDTSRQDHAAGQVPTCSAYFLACTFLYVCHARFFPPEEKYFLSDRNVQQIRPKMTTKNDS